MECASGEFKLILKNMNQEQLFNFVWMYDQYVVGIYAFKKEDGDNDISPLNIEEFYQNYYLRELTLKQSSDVGVAKD